MIISISGLPGAGKSSTAKRLSEKFNWPLYSMGRIRREVAVEKGMTLKEFNALGEDEFSTDRFVDEYQKRLGREEDSFVIDSRLGYHFIPDSFKVFIKAKLEVRAERVLSDERSGEPLKTLEEAKKELRSRLESDKRRYRKYYGVDAFSEEQYDLVLDSTSKSVEECVDRILSEADLTE